MTIENPLIVSLTWRFGWSGKICIVPNQKGCLDLFESFERAPFFEFFGYAQHPTTPKQRRMIRTIFSDAGFYRHPSGMGEWYTRDPSSLVALDLALRKCGVVVSNTGDSPLPFIPLVAVEFHPDSRIL